MLMTLPEPPQGPSRRCDRLPLPTACQPPLRWWRWAMAYSWYLWHWPLPSGSPHRAPHANFVEGAAVLLVSAAWHT